MNKLGLSWAKLSGSWDYAIFGVKILTNYFDLPKLHFTFKSLSSGEELL